MASPWRQSGLVAAVATAVFTLSATLTGGLVVGPAGPPIDPAVGLVVALSVVFGPAAVAGAVAGTVLTALLRSALAWVTVVDAGAVGLLGYVAYRLWGVLPALSTGKRPELETPGQFVEFLAVTLLAAATAVSALAWGEIVLQARLFHGVVLAEFPIVNLSALVTGVPVLLIARVIPDTYRHSYADRTPVARGTGGFRGAVLLPVCWLLVGVLLSIAATLVQSIGETTLAADGYGFVFVPFDPALVGLGGSRLQIVLGALALSLLGATWLDLNRKTQSDRLPIRS